MDEPVHSFAVLAFGESPYLEGCLRSLQAQTLPSELYIATSTPSSFLRGMADRYHVPLKVNAERGGIASDWTFAYGQCSTSYLTLAHQDDIYSSHYVESCLAAAAAEPGNLITFTDYREVWDGRCGVDTLNVRCKRLIARGNFGRSDILTTVRAKRRLLAIGCVIPCPSVMFHVPTIGEFTFSRSYQVNIDWDAWLRLAELEGAFLYVRETLLEHRIHDQAVTTISVTAGQRQHEDRLIMARLWPEWMATALAGLYGISLRTKKWHLPSWGRIGPRGAGLRRDLP